MVADVITKLQDAGDAMRVERPRDVFNLSLLKRALGPGRRILLNAIPANGLFAPTSDTS
jgi:hypothetical protein